MADAPEQPNDGFDLTQPYPGAATGALHPALVQAVRDAPTEGDKEWTGAAANEVQSFLTTRALVNQNDQERQDFITNLDQTKNNLVNMVKSDPNSTALALDLAGPAAYRFVEHHPDDAERDTMHEGIADHLQQEIARASVQSHADINQAAGHEAIDRLKPYLADGDEEHLRQYTDNMQMVRETDQSAAQNMYRRGMIERSGASSQKYFGQLMDLETGAVQFPPGWGQKLMQDHSISPDARRGLLTAYQGLIQNGDVTSSDPNLVHDLLARAAQPYHSPDHPQPHEVVSHAGQGLTMADAQFIASQTGRQSPAQRDTTQRLAEGLANARATIGNDQAFGRFTNWFLPSYQRAVSMGVAPLDLLHPDSKGNLLSPEKIAGFMPNGNDVIARAVPAGGPRRSLKEIFGG